MNKKPISPEEFDKQLTEKNEMYFHSEYEDAVARIVVSGEDARVFVKHHTRGSEYEVQWISGMAMDVRMSPVPISREDYYNF